MQVEMDFMLATQLAVRAFSRAVCNAGNNIAGMMMTRIGRMMHGPRMFH
jgi:hypothetical protein